MKKGIIVLLIAVLVSGFAFAAFSGNAKITLGTDLDAKTFGFGNWATGKYTFSFTYDTLAAGKDAHETDLWAEIAAEGSVKLSSEAKLAADTDVHAVANPSATADGAIKATFKITKANIHVKDFTFGILNMGKGPNYAASYYVDDDGNPILNVLGGPVRFVPGFTVSYKDYNAGFGIKGSWNDEKVTIATAGWVETKTFKFGENEEFSAQAGAYAQYFNSELVGGRKFAGVALKGGYAAEKLTANAAADLQIIRAGGKNVFAFEASADVTYTINENGKAGVNVYSVYDKVAIVPADYTEKVKLDAKLWANYKFDFSGTTLATEGYVEVRDALLEAKREISVYAKETLTVMEGKLALEFSELYKIVAKTLKLTAKATYTADKFVAWAAIKDITFAFSDSFAVTALKPEVGIKSTKVIENAEVGLVWTGANFVKTEDAKKVGSIEAYAKIAF